jgi:hypothetical protein
MASHRAFLSFLLNYPMILVRIRAVDCFPPCNLLGSERSRCPPLTSTRGGRVRLAGSARSKIENQNANRSFGALSRDRVEGFGGIWGHIWGSPVMVFYCTLSRAYEWTFWLPHREILNRESPLVHQSDAAKAAELPQNVSSAQITSKGEDRVE